MTPERVTELLETHDPRGAAVNERDADGETALIVAATLADSRLEVLSALIDAGADVNARSEEGLSAWDFIEENDCIRDTDAYRRIRDGGLV